MVHNLKIIKSTGTKIIQLDLKQAFILKCWCFLMLHWEGFSPVVSAFYKGLIGSILVRLYLRSASEGTCFLSHHVPNTYNSVGMEELPHGYLAVNTLDFTFELLPLHAAYLMTCHQLSVD